MFVCEACRILAPWQGMESTAPALKDKVLTTLPPGKSLPMDSWAIHKLDNTKYYQFSALCSVPAILYSEYVLEKREREREREREINKNA